MKRFLIILAICVMCAAFLGGCTGGESSDATEFVTEFVDAN